MTRLRSANLAQDYESLFGAGTLAGVGDGPLLERFIVRRDEVAFEELLARHGPAVLGICRRWLDDPRDVEDAFQATFLILVRKAAELRNRTALSSWIHGVALRVARRARANAARRGLRERPIATEPADRAPAPGASTEGDVAATVEEEIRRLPEGQQLAVILCLREGYTHEAAARELGWPLGTVKSRIAAARRTLARRLSRRGLAPSGVAPLPWPGPGLGGPTAAISPELARRTLEAIRGPLAGSSIPAAGLARQVLSILLAARLRWAAVLLMTLGTLAWAAPALLRARPAGEARTGPMLRHASALAAPPPGSPRVDRYGDPLPPGAVMRLGTVRFRQPPLIRRIVYSPDGRLVATHGGERRLHLRDARDGKLLRQLDPGIESIGDFAFSPDGSRIAAVGFRLEPGRDAVANRLAFIDVATGRAVGRGDWDDPQSVEKVAYAPDGRTVATAGLDGVLRIWDVATAKLRRQGRLEGGRDRQAIAFSQGAGGRLLAIAWEQAIDLWDVEHLHRLRRIATDRAYRPDCLAFSPDGSALAAGVASRGAEIRLWNVADGSLLRRLKSRKDAHVSQMAFSPDGRVLAAIGWGGPLATFETATGKELDLFAGARLVEGPLAFSPDGRTFATTGDRQALHFRDVATGEDRLATPDDHEGDVVALDAADDGRTIVSGSRDRSVRTWDLATGRSTRMLPHDGWVESLSVSADGSLLATGSAASPNWGRIRVWDLRTGERLLDRDAAGAGPHILRGVALGGDGSSAFAALSDGSLRRWDLSTGKERPVARPKLEKLPADGMMGLDDIHRAVFSRDVRSVALMGRGWVQVVDVAGGDRRFKSPASGTACEFAPDGQSLAVVREGPGKRFQAGRWRGSSLGTSTVAWLDGRTGQVRREIEIPESRVKALAFSPDGEALAAGTFLLEPTRGIIRVFRLRDKKEIRAIESPCPGIEALGFTPDGRRIAAGLGDTSIVIWDVQPAG